MFSGSAKMATPIEMLFGLWTQEGPREAGTLEPPGEYD